MNDPLPIPIEDVVPHVFYQCTSWDSVNRAALVDDSPSLRRELRALTTSVTAPVPLARFRYPAERLPGWLTVDGMRRVFSAAGRGVIEERLLSGDRLSFIAFDVELPDGSIRQLHHARPAGEVEALADGSIVGRLGVARRWALELSKLHSLSFFPVPHMNVVTAVRGSTLTALAELGGAIEALPLPVVRDGRRVDYAEWAEHPEWTTP